MLRIDKDLEYNHYGPTQYLIRNISPFIEFFGNNAEFVENSILSRHRQIAPKMQMYYRHSSIYQPKLQ